MLARPGSRVLLCSSPWGSPEHFFRLHWEQGMAGATEHVQAWHWPSTVSPLVDGELLEQIRPRSAPAYFAREYLAQWSESLGLFFTRAELDGAVADYELIVPGRDARRRAPGWVVGGLDYGNQADSSTLVLLAPLADGGVNVRRCGEEPVLFIPWLESHSRTLYNVFLSRVLEVCDPEAGGFHVRYLASEMNGVGAGPTETLIQQAWQRGLRTRVAGVHTSARRKASGFGAIKMLLQSGRLVLPRHPELLRQLASLEFEERESGLTRIAVPERGGQHDDLAMGLCQAVSAVRVSVGRRWYQPDSPLARDPADEIVTGAGTRIRVVPRCWDFRAVFRPPAGEDDTELGW